MQEFKDARLHQSLRKKFLTRILAGAVGAAALALVIWYLVTLPPASELDVLSMCVQHGRVGMHIHPEISIFMKGKEELIPANIGISPSCMRPIHTHDEIGTIHLEFPVYREVKLGDFFRVWGKPFNQNWEGNIKMKVNGKENSDFENYLMRDNDKIEIRYE